uniref:Uncharacterized protein n=1 Tax=Anguilla anguilla TaxID=7936 RepID=A0A0E9WYH9_ANGAN
MVKTKANRLCGSPNARVNTTAAAQTLTVLSQMSHNALRQANLPGSKGYSLGLKLACVQTQSSSPVQQLLANLPISVGEVDG